MSFPPGVLKRFHDAQNAGVPSALEVALAELRSGGKRSHWIWYVLPQLRSLGRSANAQLYGIADLAEAHAYLADPLLHQRLEAVIGAYQQSCPLGVLLSAPLQSYSEMSVMPSRCGIEWSSTSGQPPRIERPAPGRG